MPNQNHLDLLHFACNEASHFFAEDIVNKNVYFAVNISLSQCTQDSAGTASIQNNIAFLDVSCPFQLWLKATYSATKSFISLVESSKPRFNV